MSSTEIRSRCFSSRAIAAGLAVTLLAVLVAGCTTTESDIPWNAPQSWEGTIGLPGITPVD